MKLTRGLLGFLAVFSLCFVSFLGIPQRHAIAQESTTALQRGYRTGYSDGYMAGYRDSIDGLARDFTRHPDYSSASRAYNKDYGTIEDYKDGYQQGFESGYGTGFEKNTFDSTVPTSLSRRDATASIDGPPPAPTSTASTTEQASPPSTTSVAEQTVPATVEQTGTVVTQNASFTRDDGVMVIAKDTELILELQDELSTARSRVGDKFTAKIVSPAEISGAIIEGRISKIQKSGRLKRRSEISMSFDRIVLSENRWGNFSGILTEVLPVRGDNVRRVDNEGAAVSKSTLKNDTIKVGSSTGTGAAVGLVAGGPVGAAVGAGVGAAFGVGAVVIERGRDIRLNVNQQLRIKTAYETQIR